MHLPGFRTQVGSIDVHWSLYRTEDRSMVLLIIV